MFADRETEVDLNQLYGLYQCILDHNDLKELRCKCHINQSKYTGKWIYTTQDRSGICHLMTHWHLSEWQQEEQVCNIQYGCWMLNKGLFNKYVLATINSIYVMSVYSEG